MAKNNGNGNGTGSVAAQPTVHLVLQGKGGIGKSVVARAHRAASIANSPNA